MGTMREENEGGKNVGREDAHGIGIAPTQEETFERPERFEGEDAGRSSRAKN